MTTSKISVDLRARTFDIEVPDERVDAVLSRLEALLKLPVELDPALAPADDLSRRDSERGDDDLKADRDENESIREEANGATGTRGKAKRPSRGATKARSYELVDLGITAEQIQQLRHFFETQEPRGQHDVLAVIGVKLKELLGKSELDANQIHSALKLVDQPTPKNISAVLANMKANGVASFAGETLIVTSYTDDYVRYRMGKKSKSKKDD